MYSHVYMYGLGTDNFLENVLFCVHKCVCVCVCVCMCTNMYLFISTCECVTMSQCLTLCDCVLKYFSLAR